MNAKTPNLFELRRGAISITYSTSGIDGRPRLHFRDGERQLDFAGEEIGTCDSAFGTLATVELSRVADG